MKKTQTKLEDDTQMRAEYDFSNGVRGKHAKAMQTGYTITVYNTDGTTVIKEVEPRKGMVMLDPDVLEYFPDSASVNATLRSLIHLVPAKRRVARKKVSTSAG